MNDDEVYDYGLALIRTAVPALWGWLASLALTAGFVIPAQVAGVAQSLLTVLLAVSWYAVWHAIEKRLPVWLTRLLLGANTAPSYREVTAPRPAPVILRPTQTGGADRT